MLILAIIGLIANVTSILILQGSQKSDLNIKSVFYHMFADAIASIGIVIIAIFIIFNPEWTVLDPIISIGISIVILAWAIGILKDSTRILLEMTPKGYNVDIISNALREEFPEILDLFTLHLWTITSDMLVFSAHVRIPDENWSILNQEALTEKINNFLLEKYNIVECTLQFTIQNEPQSCFFK
jgi:cobalt-zinc-cadmium efflux system protein